MKISHKDAVLFRYDNSLMNIHIVSVATMEQA